MILVIFLRLLISMPDKNKANINYSSTDWMKGWKRRIFKITFLLSSIFFFFSFLFRNKVLHVIKSAHCHYIHSHCSNYSLLWKMSWTFDIHCSYYSKTDKIFENVYFLLFKISGTLINIFHSLFNLLFSLCSTFELPNRFCSFDLRCPSIFQKLCVLPILPNKCVFQESNARKELFIEQKGRDYERAYRRKVQTITMDDCSRVPLRLELCQLRKS